MAGDFKAEPVSSTAAAPAVAGPTPVADAPVRYLLFASTWTHDATNSSLTRDTKLDAEAVDRHFHSLGFIPDAGSIIKAKFSRAELTKSVLDFMSFDAPLHVLCWFGHGAIGTGDWHLADGETFKVMELLKLWVDSRKAAPSHLFVLSDCCYSGGWAAAAATLQLHSLWVRNHVAFTIQSSVSAECRADAGVFTRQFWLPFISGAQTAELTLFSYANRTKVNEFSGHSPAAYSSLKPVIPGLVTATDICTSDVSATAIVPHRWESAGRRLFRPFRPVVAAATKPDPALDAKRKAKQRLIGMRSRGLCRIASHFTDSDVRLLRSDELTNSSLHASYFDDFVADKLRDGFIGRADLFTEMNRFLNPPTSHAASHATATAVGTATATATAVTECSSSRERVLLITGEPGIGKSTAAAQLISSHKLIAPPQFRALIMQFIPSTELVSCVESYLTELLIASLRDQMIGYHVCMAANSSTLEPMRFVRSLAAQFCRTVTGFSDRLIDSAPALSALRANDPLIAFAQVLKLLTATTSSATRYILVDSLDESLFLTESAAKSIAAVLSSREVLNALPAWLQIVATSRPQTDVLSLVDQWSKPFVRSIEATDEHNRKDVELFVRSKLSVDQTRSADSKAVASAVNSAVELCAGNFLVASEMVRSVTVTVPAGGWSLSALQQIVSDKTLVPGSLSSYYTAFMSRKSIDERKWRVLRIIIEVLLATRRPIAVAELLYTVRLSEFGEVRGEIELEKYLQFIQSFTRRENVRVHITPSSPIKTVISLYHKSFSDWLRTLPSSHRFAVSVKAGHRRIAAAALLVGPKITRPIERLILRELIDTAQLELPAATHTHASCFSCSISSILRVARGRHVQEAGFNRVLHHLVAGAVPVTRWHAIGIPELCFHCPAHGDASFLEYGAAVVRAVINLWAPDKGERILRSAAGQGFLSAIELLWPLGGEQRHSALGYVRARATLDLLLRLGADPTKVKPADIRTVAAAEFLIGECGLIGDCGKCVDWIYKTIPMGAGGTDMLQWLCNRTKTAEKKKFSFEVLTGFGSADFVRILLDGGFDPNARNSAGESVLMKCTPDTECCELILYACDPAKNPIAELELKTPLLAQYIAQHPDRNKLFSASRTGRLTPAERKYRTSSS